MKASRIAWLSVLQGLLLLVLLGFGTGCGALKAMANPKIAWALNDPAPMGVVVRRVDAAESTASHVDRILTATPASPDSEWLGKVAPEKDDAAAEVKAVAEESLYKKSQARVVAAEIWSRTLDDVKSDKGDKPNVLALVSDDLGDKYEKVMSKKREIADLREQIASEEEERDKKGIPDAEKKQHADKVKELETQADKLEKEVEPLQKEFVTSAKSLAAKAPADVRDKVGPALVQLRQAVDDADVSNGAAAVRYPLAISGLVDAVKGQVPIIVADIIEEQTGKRPSMDGLQPDVKLDGFTPQITLNGLSKDDLGKISIGDLTSDTVTRTTKWLGRVAGLLGYVSAIKGTLSFEADALDAILDGFTSAGWSRPKPFVMPEGASPEVKKATAKLRPRKSPKLVAAASVPKTVPGAKGAGDKSAASASKPGAGPSKPAAASTAKPPVQASAKDDRAFAQKPRSVAAARADVDRLVAVRDKASRAERAATLLKLAEAASELDYAAARAGDFATSASARAQAIAAYQELRVQFAPMVDAKMLVHLAIAYQRQGDDATAKLILVEARNY